MADLTLEEHIREADRQLKFLREQQEAERNLVATEKIVKILKRCAKHRSLYTPRNIQYKVQGDVNLPLQSGDFTRDGHYYLSIASVIDGLKIELARSENSQRFTMCFKDTGTDLDARNAGKIKRFLAKYNIGIDFSYLRQTIMATERQLERLNREVELLS